MAWSLLALPLLFLVVWFVVPFVITVILSFSYDNFQLGKSGFAGWSNYRGVLSSPTFSAAIFNTIVYSLAATSLSLVGGLILALALNSRRVRGRALFRAAFYMPSMVSVSISSLVWLWIYNPQIGILNKVVGAFGVAPQQWLLSTSLALPSLIVIGVWLQIGFAMLVYLAGLQSIPRELLEAAACDGAARLQAIRKVVVPLLRPVTVFLATVGLIQTVQVFAEVFIMTGGGPLTSTTTLSFEIYRTAFVNGDFGQAAAMTLLMFTFLLMLGAGAWKVRALVSRGAS